MWMLPLYLHINQKSDYDMMIILAMLQFKVSLIVYMYIYSPGAEADNPIGIEFWSQLKGVSTFIKYVKF